MNSNSETEVITYDKVINKLNKLKIKTYKSKQFYETIPTIEDAKIQLEKEFKLGWIGVIPYIRKVKLKKYLDNNLMERYHQLIDVYKTIKDSFEKTEIKNKKMYEEKYLKNFNKEKEKLERLLKWDELYINERVSQIILKVKQLFNIDIGFELKLRTICINIKKEEKLSTEILSKRLLEHPIKGILVECFNISTEIEFIEINIDEMSVNVSRELKLSFIINENKGSLDLPKLEKKTDSSLNKNMEIESHVINDDIVEPKFTLNKRIEWNYYSDLKSSIDYYYRNSMGDSYNIAIDETKANEDEQLIEALINYVQENYKDYSFPIMKTFYKYNVDEDVKDFVCRNIPADILEEFIDLVAKQYCAYEDDYNLEELKLFLKEYFNFYRSQNCKIEEDIDLFSYKPVIKEAEVKESISEFISSNTNGDEDALNIDYLKDDLSYFDYIGSYMKETIIIDYVDSKSYDYGMNEPDKEIIKNIVKERKIKSLIHFTNFNNLESILVQGLIPIKDHSLYGINSDSNDVKRLDGHIDSTSLSIEFTNYKLLTNFSEKSDKTFVIIKIDPSVLWDKECAFFEENAASRNMRSIDILDLKTVQAFNNMFNDSKLIKRETLNISDAYTTNPQAEVLVFDRIETFYIQELIFNDYKDKIKFQINSNHKIKCTVDTSYFSGRKDYRFWQRERSNDGK